MKRRAIFELLATYHNDSEITRFLKVTRRNNRWVYTDSMELPSEAYKFHIIDVGPGNNEQWGSCHSAPLIHARPQCQYYHVYKSAGHATEALDQVSGCMSSSKTLLSPTWPTWSWMANLELSHDHVISNTWAPSYHDLNSLVFSWWHRIHSMYAVVSKVRSTTSVAIPWGCWHNEYDGQYKCEQPDIDEQLPAKL